MSSYFPNVLVKMRLPQKGNSNQIKEVKQDKVNERNEKQKEVDKVPYSTQKTDDIETYLLLMH